MRCASESNSPFIVGNPLINLRTPLVGESIQYFTNPDGRPCAGQIVSVDPISGMIQAAVWNEVFHRFQQVKVENHGCEKGFPCWVYPGEDPGAVGSEHEAVSLTEGS